MGASFSGAGGRKALSNLAALLLAAVVLIVWRRFVSSPPPPRSVKGGGGSQNSAAVKARQPSTSTAANSDRRKGPLKGSAPQKIDLFTDLVTKMVPGEVTVEEARRRFPRKFEVHGHVVVVRLNPGVTVDEFSPLAEAFARSFSPLDVDVVLLDTDGIIGELRRPKLAVLFAKPRGEMAHLEYCPRVIRKRWKESRAKRLPTFVSEEELGALVDAYTQTETYTVHVENGVRYGFDVNKVMFCSGNTTERMHFAALDATGETVVDMFVGIGYFTLPLAMNGGVTVIHALDKNPDSVAFVRLNAVQNRVDHLVRAQCGDNRIVGDELGGKCDRVLMGLIPTCQEFLPRAIFFLKKDEAGKAVGTVHYHFLADKAEARKVVLTDVKEALGEESVHNFTVANLRCVKSYAPKRFHYVADLRFA